MTETKSSWVTAKPAEIRSKIVELAKQGMAPEKIGLVLRDQHGIPKAKLLGLKISKVLKEEKLWNDYEKANLEKKIEKLTKHSTKNSHDYKSIRVLVKKSAQLNTLSKKR